MIKRAEDLVSEFVTSDLYNMKQQDYSGIIDKLKMIPQDELEYVLAYLNIVAIDALLEAELEEMQTASSSGRIISFRSNHPVD